MTMPGRSCVALTLLIFFCGPSRVGADCSLERLRISEIQAGQEHGLIQNDSRHAGRKNVSNANQQYKCSRFPRSIGLLCCREPPKKEMFLFPKALALRGQRHSGLMNMKETSGESNQTSAARAVSAPSIDFAYFSIKLRIKPPSEEISADKLFP